MTSKIPFRRRRLTSTPDLRVCPFFVVATPRGLLCAVTDDGQITCTSDLTHAARWPDLATAARMAASMRPGWA